MGSYNNMVITTVGQALLTSVLGSQGTLTFSKFQTSSYQYSGGTDLSALTSLNSVQQEVTPSSAGVIDANNLYVSSSVDNENLVTGYTAYTLGIFATDGNSEVLFGVSTAVTPDVIPADTGGTPSTYTYRMQLAVSSTDNITIAIEPGAYALATDLANHVNSEVLSANGVHGIRAVLDNGSYKVQVNDNGTWEDASGSTGSIIMVTTGDEELFGATVTLTIGASTYTEIFSNNGTCVFYGITDTGAATVSATYQGITYTDTFTITNFGFYSAEISLFKIYGVEWDGTSTTAFSRTDDAATFTDPVPYYSGMSGTPSSPFDNISPWREMTVSDRTGGKMVKIPKFYFKWTKTGTKMKLQIIPGIYSAYALANGYQISPAHRDRGDGVGERDVVYVGRYHCASSDYKSRGGEKPKASITRDTARQAIANLGADIWQYDIAMLETIWMLYLVEFADWNSQAKIGYGCGNNSSTENMGYTDSMPYHTGTMLTSKTAYGVGTQYRNIEGIWDNVVDWCDGIYFSGADIYLIAKPSSYSDTTGGTKVGTRPTTAGWTSAFAFSSATGFEWFMYPSAVGGTDGSDYISDYCFYNASGVVLCVGGSYTQYQYRGVFFLDGDSAASSHNVGVGSRLQELPSAA